LIILQLTIDNHTVQHSDTINYTRNWNIVMQNNNNESFIIFIS